MNYDARRRSDVASEVPQPTDVGSTDGLAKERKFSKGTQTMFRTTLHTHMQLSLIADNKANIMISINSIIISLVVSLLVQKFETYPHLIIPTLLLLVSCLTTIVFAILATRPNLEEGKLSREDITQKPASLLFFGDFHQMDREDYRWGMQALMQSDNQLYDSLIYHLYDLGKMLARKYYYLKISYTAFLVGLVVSVLAFSLAFAH